MNTMNRISHNPVLAGALTLLMGASPMALAHKDIPPSSPPETNNPIATLQVEAPRQVAENLAKPLILADAGTRGEVGDVIRHTKKGTEAAASLISSSVNSAAKHGDAAAKHGDAAAKHGDAAAKHGDAAAKHGDAAAQYGDALQHAKASARNGTLSPASTLLD